MANRQITQRGSASRRTDGKPTNQTRANSTCLSAADRDRWTSLLGDVEDGVYSGNETGGTKNSPKVIDLEWSEATVQQGEEMQSLLAQQGAYKRQNTSWGEFTRFDCAALDETQKGLVVSFLASCRSDLECAGVGIAGANGVDSWEEMHERKIRVQTKKGMQAQFRDEDLAAGWGFGYIEHRTLQKLGERQWAQPKARTGVVASPAPVSAADEIKKLGELLKDGLLTKKEFAEQKALLLAKE